MPPKGEQSSDGDACEIPAELREPGAMEELAKLALDEAALRESIASALRAQTEGGQ